MYDGRRVIQERNSANTPTVTYNRGPDLSGSFEGAGGIGGLLARSHGYSGSTGAWSTHHYYHADGGGNITALAQSRSHNFEISQSLLLDGPSGIPYKTPNMRNIGNPFAFLSWSLVPLCLLLVLTQPVSAHETHEFRAGIAVRVVTPNPLLPVSGGMGPSSPTTEQRGDLNVRALVMETQDTRVAIVSADFLGFPAVLGDRVRERVASIPPSNILIGATHTHSAPDCYGFPDERGQFSTDLGFLDFVGTAMVEAIHEAMSSLEPASVKIATGDARGKIAFNYYAEPLFDSRCHVIQFLNASQQPIATLVNYAIHPEVLGSDQGILSPDLVGPLYDRIAERGGGVGIFMNGALGGMITADNRGPDGKSRRTWAECLRIGHLLADESLRIVADAPIQPSPFLFCAARTITFPVDSPPLRAVMRLSPLGYPSDDFTRISTVINIVNLGNAQILTIPGEAMPNIGAYLQRKLHGEHNLLFGLTNDAFGYILTPEDWGAFPRYEYVSRVSLGERTGAIYVREALRLADDCPRPQRLVQHVSP